jgi:gliding motility-associated-like protein
MINPSDLTATCTSVAAKCYGVCDGSVTIIGNLGTAPYHYVWPNGINPSQTSTVPNLCSGQYVITVLDNLNCVYHQVVNVLQPDSLYSEITLLTAIPCKDSVGSIEINSQGGTPDYTYTWSNGNSGSQLIDIHANTYYVTTSDHNNCTYQNAITLDEPSALESTYRLTHQLCVNNCNGAINAYPTGGTAPFFYTWSNMGTRSEINSLCEGEYFVTITDAKGCKITRDFVIYNDLYVPDLFVTADTTTIYVGQHVQLLAHSSDDGFYLWNEIFSLNNPRIPNPIASPSVNTTYTVTFVANNKCYVVDTIAIKVKELICNDPYIFVPSAFTPDGDGQNDFFKPYYPASMIKEAYFAVYDRWGNIIYESNDLHDKGWNGTYRNKELATDVYAFYLHAICINGEIYNHKGNVTLLR